MSPTDSRPECSYGSKCFRKNLEHLIKYKHPHLEKQGMFLQQHPVQHLSGIHQHQPMQNQQANQQNTIKQDDDEEEKPKKSEKITELNDCIHPGVKLGKTMKKVMKSIRV